MKPYNTGPASTSRGPYEPVGPKEKRKRASFGHMLVLHATVAVLYSTVLWYWGIYGALHSLAKKGAYV